MLFRSHTGSQAVKTTLANIMVELEGASIQSISMLMVKRESLVQECLVKVEVESINWDLSQTREGFSDLMEGVAEGLSLSTAVLFEECLEDLAPELTALVSSAVIHNHIQT